MKETFIKIFHQLNYIEWICCISCVIFMLILAIWIGHEVGYIIGVIFSIVCISMICGIHGIRYINDADLYKHKCNYQILNITIDNKTYYFPIIKVLTKWGTYFKVIIKEDENEEKTKKFFLTCYSVDDINNDIKRDYCNIEKYINQGLCYFTQEDASYVISQCQQYINKQKEIRSNIESNNLNISFKQ